MRIALLHYTSPPVVGGVESVLAQHARLMSKAGHQVTILAGRGEVFDETVGVHLLPSLDSRKQEVMHVKAQLDQGELSADFDALRDQIKADLLTALRGFEVLFAHNVASLHKNLALTAALHAVYQTQGFPRLILWHHDLAWVTRRYQHEMHDGYPWDLLRQHWEGVVHVVVSEVRRQELSNLLKLPTESIHLIANGVDLSSFYKLEPETNRLVEQLSLFRADPLFLLPVRLTPRKNVELALYIMAELCKTFPNAKLLVTGPEGPHNPDNALYKQKLLDQSRDLNLQDRVRFLTEVTPGYISDAVMADFYRLADALIFPSREEGFGIPMIEAAVSSLPVFCANIPVLRELGGEDVSYFELDEAPASIAAMITDRLRSEATWRWARRAKHHYTWDAIYDLLIAPLLQEVEK